MSGVCHRLDRITHRSLSDVAKSGPEVARMVYVGKSADEFDPAIANQKPSIYTPFWENVVADLGMTVLAVEQSTIPVLADTTYFCDNLDLEVSKGDIIGVEKRLELKTSEGLRLVGENSLRLCAEGEEEFKEYLIQGEPNLEIRATRLENAFTTASQAVNRIPDVINAQPGYITLEQLPKLTFKQQPLSTYLKSATQR